MKQETIHIEKLSIGYPGKGDVKVVASDICAGINSGELTCLLGANGVGKSTLLRTLSAFQPKLSGEIRIQGKEIGSYTDKQLSKVISVVLTEKCDIRNMTSVELIGLGRSPYTGFWGTLSKEDKEVVDHAINLVGISHLAHRMVHTLSDGERQKVMIAKALYCCGYLLIRLRYALCSGGRECLSCAFALFRHRYASGQYGRQEIVCCFGR